MKISVFILVTVSCLSNCLYSQSSDCLKSLRKGTFGYVGEHEDCVIIRTGSIQKEIWDGGKSIMIMKIKWVGNDEYLLTIKKLINVTGPTKIGDILDVKIISCNNGRYTYLYRMIRAKTVIYNEVKPGTIRKQEK